MIDYLLDLGPAGDVVVNNKAIILLPELLDVYNDSKLGSDMIRWIVAMEDHKSPFRRLPTDEREKTVTYKIFGKERHKATLDDKVVRAREEYRKLQFDPLIDQYNAMTDQMYEINKVYRAMKPSASNLDDMNDMTVKMQKAAEARDKVRALIIKDQETNTKIHGSEDNNLSRLEQRMRLDNE